MLNLVIESLFPEFCNQGGDNGNMMYLRASLPEAEFVETHYMDEPAFATRPVDLIYAGYMTEAEQELAAKKLMPFRDRLIELAEAGCVILFTGNAAELLGSTIAMDDGRVVPGLNLFDFTTKQDLSKRIVEVFVGRFEPSACAAEDVGANASTGSPLDIVGYKIQFTQAQMGDGTAVFADALPFCTAEIGFGRNRSSALEGFRYKNLIATWLCGPLLPLNPLLTEHLICLMGVGCSEAAFRNEALAAYTKRLEEFRTPGIKMPI